MVPTWWLKLDMFRESLILMVSNFKMIETNPDSMAKLRYPATNEHLSWLVDNPIDAKKLFWIKLPIQDRPNKLQVHHISHASTDLYLPPSELWLKMKHPATGRMLPINSAKTCVIHYPSNMFLFNKHIPNMVILGFHVKSIIQLTSIALEIPSFVDHSYGKARILLKVSILDASVGTDEQCSKILCHPENK